jgi:hypothetical protein
VKITEFVGKLLGWLRSMLSIEKLLAAVEAVRAAIAAALAFATGSWASGAIALGILGAAVGIGYGIYSLLNNMGGDKDGGSSEAGNRPVRRDDWQRMRLKAYAKDFTG